MKTNLKVLVIAVAAAIVAVALAGRWHVRQAAAAAVAERATLVAGRAEQESARHRWEARLAAAEKDQQELQGALARARAAMEEATSVAKAPVAAGAPSSPTQKGATGPINPAELLAQDPRLQVLYLESRRAAFATTHGPLAARLGLTPAQLDQLAAAKTKWREQADDLAAIVRERKLPANDPTISELRKQADDELRAAELAVLGAAGYEQLREYEPTLPAREIVARFAGAAAIGDVPLNAAQADQLTRIVAGAAGDGRRGGAIDPVRIDWALVDAQAQAVLTPAQLALFQRIEPVGGGLSRWITRFQTAVDRATGRRKE